MTWTCEIFQAHLRISDLIQTMSQIKVLDPMQVLAVADGRALPNYEYVKAVHLKYVTLFHQHNVDIRSRRNAPECFRGGACCRQEELRT